MRNLELAISTDLTTLKDALSYISPDAARGTGSIIGSDGAPSEDNWFGVILAIRRQFGGQGEAVAREWSEGSARYDEDGFNKAWEAYDASHASPVTIRSVYRLAQAYGWAGTVPPFSALQLPVVEPRLDRFRLLDRCAIMAIQPVQWRVKGIFPTIGIGAIYGPSGSGKSFLAMDLSVCITSGRMWFGYRTRACPVTYVMLEGEAGLRNRIDAWEMHSGNEISSDFRATVQAVAMKSRVISGQRSRRLKLAMSRTLRISAHCYPRGELSSSTL